MNKSLAFMYPELVAEWSERNLPFKPGMITPYRNQKVW